MFIKRSIIFCFVAAFGGFTFGYDIGYISSCLIMPTFQQQYGTGHDANGGIVLTSKDQSIITSLLSAGTFFGALLQSFTSDRLGRKYSIMFWSTIFTIGIVIQVSSFAIGQLAAGRCVAGLGVGALSAIVPLYIGEAAPKKLRGSLLVLYQVQIATGLFLAYVFDLGTHHLQSSAAYRIPIGLQIAWGLILICGAWVLPESPRWLLGQGKTKQALQSIAKLNDVSPDDALTQEIMAELEEAVREENDGGKASWFEVFAIKNNMWKRTTNGMMIQTLQQLVGQNFYYYYGAVFFQRAETGLSSYEIQVVLGGVSLAMVLPATYTIEWLGRRRSLMIGAAIMACCALIAGVVGGKLVDPPAQQVGAARQKAGSQVLVAFAIIQVAFYSLLWGPTPWVILGETFPLRTRSKQIALGSAANWFWNFMLSYFSPLISDDIGSYILLIFFGCLVFDVFYVYFMLPETRGISLEDVDELYRTGVKPWKSQHWKPSRDRGAALDAVENGRRPAEIVSSKRNAVEHDDNATVVDQQINEKSKAKAAPVA